MSCFLAGSTKSGISGRSSSLMSAIAKGFNEYGDPIMVEGSDLLARCVQHETDHLDGVLFVDRLDAETKRLAFEQIRDADWQQPVVLKASPHPLFGQAL